VLFLRTRTLGYATAIEGTLDDLASRQDLPLALLKIVGLDPPPEADERAETFEPGDEPEEVLLSKPANPEQIRIAVRLERDGCVLVQGPPGTGKTHTIANLIGHLLAQGQSVLVTSHTTKALRVLRDHVVEKLRPLTVSVLESDIESRNQLEGSVSTIIERLTTGNPKKLDAEAEQLAAQRKELLAQLRKHRQELFDARADEYKELVFGKTKLSPSDAARKVAAEAQTHGWIPSPVQPGAALPLSTPEVPSNPPPGTIQPTVAVLADTSIDPTTGVIPTPNTSACAESMTINLATPGTMAPANATGAAATPGVSPAGC